VSFAAMMVHIEVERDSEQRIQLALGLADRFQAALVGVAGWVPQPVFAGELSEADLHEVAARFDAIGRKFRTQGQNLNHVDWRSCFDTPADTVVREARSADLIIVGARHESGNVPRSVDPSVILMRAGRPVLVVPDIVGPLQLRRAVVAWKDTRECHRAVSDALPLLQQAKEVLLLAIGEGDEIATRANSKLTDVASYMARHGVIVADQIWRPGRGPVATELLRIVRDEKVDLIVAGGYGHSRLGEWIFGGVTHELLGATPVCCLLSH
jgi:nucleotide-binding universal stress UspA family protein